MQVVGLHYTSAFLPAIGLQDAAISGSTVQSWFIHTPLFFLVDGQAAVYVFFLISGAALTYSFNAHKSVVEAVAGRVIRLGLPMIAAMLFGAGLLWAMPATHVEAGRLTGSVDWMVRLLPRLSLSEVLHQLFIEGMPAGYSDFSVLPNRLVSGLHSAGVFGSFNAPLWTLHVEFYGSLIVLALTRIGAWAGNAVRVAACVAFIVIFSGSALMLFGVGHLTAPYLARDNRSQLKLLCGCILLAAGISLCFTSSFDTLDVFKHFPRVPWGAGDTPFLIQSATGAIGVFLGVALLSRVRKMLQSMSMRWVGRMSFALYLTHFPILLTLAAAVFLALQPLIPYAAAVSCACVAGLIVTIPATVVFERWIDRLSVSLSRRMRAPVRQAPAA